MVEQYLTKEDKQRFLQIHSFTVTITKEFIQTEIVGKDWTVIDERIEEGQLQPTSQYGFTPEIEKLVKKSIVIYEQSIEDLDLPAVIAAVNQLKLAT